MNIKNLNKRTDLDQNGRLNKKHLQFQELITELRDRELIEGNNTRKQHNIFNYKKLT